MVVLWILGILLALLVVILLLRVGVVISFGEELSVQAKAGPVAIQLVPKPEKKRPKKPKKPKEKKPKKKKEEVSKPSDGEKKQKKKLNITFEDIRTVVPAILEALVRGLRKTRRRLKIDPMRLSLIFGGDDPAQVAQSYGWASTAVWTFMPQLERVTRMPDPYIHLDVDYQSMKTRAEGQVGLSFQIRDLFAIGFAFAWPVLKWLPGFLKRQKAQRIILAQEAQEAEKAAQKAETVSAAETEKSA